MCWQMVSDISLIHLLRYQVRYSTHSSRCIIIIILFGIMVFMSGWLSERCINWYCQLNAHWQLYLQVRTPVPTEEEGGWFPGSVWIVLDNSKSLSPARTQTMDHSACGQSLHWLHYPDSLACKLITLTGKIILNILYVALIQHELQWE